MSATRAAVCPYCGYTCCKPCFATYLKSSSDDPSCMNPDCRHILVREDIMKIMNKTFLGGEYKRIREERLFEREVSMMPSTQVFVNQELQRRENEKLVEALQQKRLELRRQLGEIEHGIRDASRQTVPALEEKRNFVHRCAAEGCKGFLSQAWKCGICNGYTCSTCGVYKGAHRDVVHTCQSEDSATMETIRSECRRCPGCAEYIQKIDGCDQMWCTACHTAFSWRTGQKINGMIHNPHFYAWRRDHGSGMREHGDVPCGGMPSLQELSEVLPRAYEHRSTTFSIHQLIRHVEIIELPRFPVTLVESNNLDLRIQYMLSEISDDKFKARIQQREKQREKRCDVGHVFHMFHDTSRDIMRQMVLDKRLNEHLTTLLQLIAYSNGCMLEISERYDCVVPIICRRRFIVTNAHAQSGHTALYTQ